ncbi:hypothetical protein Lal_00046540 [Lupinus albus]|nr:hypothetical protein Lal_00046540 [Lupinus albus]
MPTFFRWTSQNRDTYDLDSAWTIFDSVEFPTWPWKNAPACLGKLAGALGGSPMARHPDPPRQPWLNNSKLASKFGAIFMKGSAPYHAFTEIGNASEAKKTHTRHGTCPWATFAFT